MPEGKFGKIALILRVLMGTFFVYAGGLKILSGGLEKFVLDIENYKLVSGNLAIHRRLSRSLGGSAQPEFASCSAFSRKAHGGPCSVLSSFLRFP